MANREQTLIENVLLRLTADTIRFDREAANARDRHNKGYFEGKAEQCRKVADALSTGDLDCLNDDH